MFFDRSGGLRAAIPHERVQVRAGEVEKGITRRVPRLEALARRIAAILPAPSGALCFQAIVAPDGEASVFEINARFGGGYPLRSEEHTSELQSLMRISYAVFCLKKKKIDTNNTTH